MAELENLQNLHTQDIPCSAPSSIFQARPITPEALCLVLRNQIRSLDQQLAALLQFPPPGEGLGGFLLQGFEGHQLSGVQLEPGTLAGNAGMFL